MRDNDFDIIEPLSNTALINEIKELLRGIFISYTTNGMLKNNETW